MGFMANYMQEVAMEANHKKRQAVVAKFVRDYSPLFTGQQYQSDLTNAARFEDLPSAARLAFQTALKNQGYDVVPDGAGYSPLSTPPGSPKGTPSSPRRSNPGDYGEEAYPPPPQSTTISTTAGGPPTASRHGGGCVPSPPLCQGATPSSIIIPAQAGPQGTK